MDIQDIINRLNELEGKTLPSLKGADIVRGRKIKISVKSSSISATKGNSNVYVSFDVIIKIYKFLLDKKEHKVKDIKEKGIIQDECSIIFVLQIFVHFDMIVVKGKREYVFKLI